MHKLIVILAAIGEVDEAEPLALGIDLVEGVKGTASLHRQKKMIPCVTLFLISPFCPKPSLYTAPLRDGNINSRPSKHHVTKLCLLTILLI